MLFCREGTIKVRRPGRLVLLCVAAAIAVAVGGVWATASGGGPEPLSADEELAVTLVNADRAAQGLPPLRVNMTLVALARDYAQDMIDRNFASHTSPDGETLGGRLARCGVVYLVAGENLAMNSSVDAAERALMGSESHRANILGAGFTEVGVGVRRGPGGAVYIVQEFVGR